MTERFQLSQHLIPICKRLIYEIQVQNKRLNQIFVFPAPKVKGREVKKGHSAIEHRNGIVRNSPPPLHV